MASCNINRWHKTGVVAKSDELRNLNFVLLLACFHKSGLKALFCFYAPFPILIYVVAVLMTLFTRLFARVKRIVRS